jgi:MFS family permease
VSAEPARAAELQHLGREFKLYLTAKAISVLGDRIALIALTFLVISLSHSFPLALSLFYICRLVPTLVGGLVVGVFVDHFSRQRLMIVCDLGRAVILAVVPSLGLLHIWIVYPLVVALYAFTVVFDTSARAGLPDVVPDTRMLGANALLQSVETGGDLGYLVGGALIYTLSLRLPFYIDAGTFLISAGLVSLMRIPGTQDPIAPTWRDIPGGVRDGFRLLMATPFLRWSTVTLAVAPVAGGAAFVLTPLFAQHVLQHSAGIVGPLHSGAFRYGLLQGGEALGALLGSLLIGPLARRMPRGRLFGIGVTGMGLADGSLAFITNVYGATAALLVAGLFNSLFVISGVTLVQSLTSTEVRGRVVSSRFTVVNTALAVGAAIGGSLLLVFSYRSLWIVEGAVIVAGSLFVWAHTEVRGQR